MILAAEGGDAVADRHCAAWRSSRGLLQRLFG